MGKRKVLIVDNEPDFLAILSECFWAVGFEVVTALDGEQALEAYTSYRDITLVVTDIAMPKLNGFEMLKAILKLDPWLPIIVMSATFGIEGYPSVQELKAAGVNECFAKPFEPDDLVHTGLALNTNTQ